jgi:tRNA (cytidine/uridine-2'-O-)-methyltransferase
LDGDVKSAGNVKEPFTRSKQGGTKVAQRDEAHNEERRGQPAMHLALFQPDIPANAGAIMRLAACLDLPLAIVEPCGFILDDRRLRRAALDYRSHLRLVRLSSWRVFESWRSDQGSRLVLLTTRAAMHHHAVRYRPEDVLLCGRETAGVPEEVHAAADLRVSVPIAPGRRSLNVVTALAMVAGEALRQTGGWPSDPAHAGVPAMPRE